MEKTWQGRSDAHQVAVKSTTTRPPAEARHSSKSSLHGFDHNHIRTHFVTRRRLGKQMQSKHPQTNAKTHTDTCADILVQLKVRWHSGIVLKRGISWNREL